MRVTVAMEVVSAEAEGVYGVGADLNVGPDTVKVFSLYVIASSKYQAIYQSIARILDELPEGATEVVVRSSCQHFRNKQRIVTKLGPVAGGRGVHLIIGQLRRKNTDAMVLADDAIKRQGDCIAKIN